MRISPISVSYANNYHNSNLKNVQNPNFKGWGGALGTILGAGAGVLLTAASGGALAWTIPALSGGGAIGGDIFQHRSQPSAEDDSDYDYDYNYNFDALNYRDY